MEEILIKWYASQNEVTKSTTKEVVQRKLSHSSRPKRHKFELVHAVMALPAIVGLMLPLFSK